MHAHALHVRGLRFALVLATLVASAFPARATTESVPIERLTQQLRDAHYARIGLGQQLREAHYTRVGIDGHTYQLINPEVFDFGLAYEDISGFPRRQPAIIAGADWDSVPAPPNPIPWTRIDRIETGRRSLAGAKVGAIFGLAMGICVGVALTSGDFIEAGPPTQGRGPIIVGSGLMSMLFWGCIGALIPTTSWEQVYPPSNGASER